MQTTPFRTGQNWTSRMPCAIITFTSRVQIKPERGCAFFRPKGGSKRWKYGSASLSHIAHLLEEKWNFMNHVEGEFPSWSTHIK